MPSGDGHAEKGPSPPCTADAPLDAHRRDEPVGKKSQPQAYYQDTESDHARMPRPGTVRMHVYTAVPLLKFLLWNRQTAIAAATLGRNFPSAGFLVSLGVT